MKTLKEVGFFFRWTKLSNTIEKCYKALFVDERFIFYFNKIVSKMLEIIFKFWLKFRQFNALQFA